MYKQLIIGLAAGALAATSVAAYADPHDKGGQGDHGDNGGGKGNHGNGGNDRGNDDRGGNGGHNNGSYGNDRNAQHYEAPRHDNGNHYGQQKQAYAAPRYANTWQGYHQYDYGHPAPGQTHYYANQYYRSGSYYQPRQLGPGDRIYRGQDNRYYCRRSDGTTGLIIGGLTGGTLGAALSPGGSQTLGALLGGSLGAILGSSIDHGNVTCR
jgi:hypothetical protein